MKFSTQEDMEAPISTVFEMLSSFEQFERAAMRRGADVQRIDEFAGPCKGMKWNAQFVLRGRGRNLDLEMIRFDPPNEMVMQMQSQGLHGETKIELIALSRARTRVIVGLDIKPHTLPARVLLQSLKLTKSTLNNRFKERVRQYLQDMEERHERSA